MLLFVIGTFALLAPVVHYVPKDGWEINGVSIRFLSEENFFTSVKQVKKDITSIVAEVDTSAIEENNQLTHYNSSSGNMGAPSGGELSTESETVIFLSENGRENLHRFFDKLQQVANEKAKIHVLHYGDSQIEGDRMTAYIRQMIQIQFGGNGPGLVPAVNVYNTISFKQSYSANFDRYTCFGGKKLNLVE